MAQNIAESIEKTMVPLPAPLLEDLIAPTPQAILVEGGVGTGKTQTLIDHVAQLLRNGVDPHDILVFCATPDAAARFLDRMGAIAPAAAHVTVTTTRAWCLDVLGTPEAQEQTGRTNRLLAPFEVDLLMEDMKTGGMRPKRLREMLRFFYKSLTELCDWNKDWLLTGEEELTYNLLRDCLRCTRAILEPELANTVARYLFDSDAALGVHARAHVVVDDYQMLSRASQVLANKLATQSIAVAADPALALEVFDSYPYDKGPDELQRANPQIERRTLCASFTSPAALQAIGNLVSGVDVDIPVPKAHKDVTVGTFKTMAADDPSLERDEVVKAVKDALARAIQPSDIMVMAPSQAWMYTVAGALAAQGIPVEVALSPKSVSGDPRTLDRCIPARVLTALYLVADPSDSVAWRSWCGFGDPFACSSALQSVRAAALGAEETLGQALERHIGIAQKSGVNRSEHDHIETARQTALSIIEDAAGLDGEDLLRFLTDRVAGEGSRIPATVRSLTAPLTDGRHVGDGAACMAKRARERLDLPRWESGTCVRIGPIGCMAGLTCDVLVLCGFVNGFFPVRGVLDREILVQEDADKQIAQDARLLTGALGKTTSDVVITTFGEVDLEVAERLGIKIGRIQLNGKKRVARIQPSAYLALMRG